MSTAFHRDGYAVIEQIIDLEQLKTLQAQIASLTRLIARKHGISLDHLDDMKVLSQGTMRLANTNRTAIGTLYDSVKLLPCFQRFVALPVFGSLFQKLRPQSMPGFAQGGCGIRLDLPGEEKFRAHWHQEYLSQLRSVDGLTFWCPLVELTEAMGPVQILRGSHRNGILKTTHQDGYNANAYSLRLVDERRLLNEYPIDAPMPKLGDVLVIDFKTVHASGFNVSASPRWSLQTRYFNFLDPVGQAYGWQGSYANGVDFRKIHPELYVGDQNEV